MKMPLTVTSASWQGYSLPLQKPLTTGAGAGHRQGLLLSLELRQGDQIVTGTGEVAPLPGKPFWHVPAYPHKQQLKTLWHVSVCKGLPMHAVSGFESA